MNAHGRLKFVCVWCEGREATFRKAVDPEAHVTMAHKSVYKEAPQDAFGESGCFWLSKFPKDYLRLVKPSQRYGAEARFLKRALERWWPTLQKNSSKTMADWRAGWSLVPLFSPSPPPELDYNLDQKQAQLDLHQLTITTEEVLALLYEEQGSSITWYKTQVKRDVLTEERQRNSLMHRFHQVKTNKGIVPKVIKKRLENKQLRSRFQ